MGSDFNPTICVVVLVDTYTSLAPNNTYLELTPEAIYENNSK